MPWNPILIALLGGFIFLDWSYYTRLRHQGLDGYRILLESAFAGSVLAIVACFVTAACEHAARVTSVVWQWRGAALAISLIVALLIAKPYYQKFPHFNKEHATERLKKSVIAGGSIPLVAWIILWACFYPNQLNALGRVWKELVPFDYSGTAVIALLIGLLAVTILNYLSDYDVAALYAAQQSGDYVLHLCYQAAQSDKPITIILSNGLAYRGYVVLSPNLKPESQLAMILIARGCLAKDSSKVRWESDYALELERLRRSLKQEEEGLEPAKSLADAKKLIVTIPSHLIEHAHLSTKDLDEGSSIAVATELPNRGGAT